MRGAGGQWEGRPLESRILTRMGDGSLVEMTRSEIRADVEEGVAVAVRRAKVPPLGEAEIEHIIDIYASSARFTGVDIGTEVMLSFDGTGTQQIGGRVQDLVSYEQMLGADSVELWNMDYSYKAAKAIVPPEQGLMRSAQALLTVPVHYGAMPDLGDYTKPDGPIDNWADLLPQGRIEEARAAQEAAVEQAADDMFYVAGHMWDAGSDGSDFDTAGAAGDADFLATLLAVERLRAAHPDMSIEVGMASEFVIGMHGGLEFHGIGLAGAWPKAQLEALQAAGATIYGPAVNVNTGKSCAWNCARAAAIVKPAADAAKIPVHMNVGMGVGAVPMCLRPPVDAVCRASKALVEVLGLDGL
jgi:dimethylamine--corrinoid protein Co-methyltransferase